MIERKPQKPADTAAPLGIQFDTPAVASHEQITRGYLCTSSTSSFKRFQRETTHIGHHLEIIAHGSTGLMYPKIRCRFSLKRL